MKLIGYIRPYKDFSFTIPIYKDGSSFYFHNLDEKLIIRDFTNIDIDTSYLIELTQLINYTIGDKAPIVFIGENGKLIINKSDIAIFEICKYLDQINTPKKYIQEELFYYANQIGCNIEHFQNKFKLKYFVNKTIPIIYEDISKLIYTIENNLSNHRRKRKRKATLKFQRNYKNAFGLITPRYDPTIIDGFKNYFISNLKDENIRKAFHQLEKLLNYQITVSEPKHIVKSFCDISQSLFNLGYLNTSRILLLLSKIFDIDDAVIDTQLAELLIVEGDLQAAKKLYIEIQKQFPDDIVAKTGFAELLKAEGNLQAAKKLYIEIQEKFPDSIVPKTGFAELLKTEGNLQAAKKLYIEIQEKFPDSIVPKTGFAELLKTEGNLQAAEKLYIEIQEKFPDDLYSKHALIVCQLMNNDFISIDKSFFVKSEPKSINDYYFYHSFIVYNIKLKKYSTAEKLLLNEIDRIPFYKTKVLFNQTLVYLKIRQNKYLELLNEINNIFAIEESNPIDNVFKIHIYSENSMIDKATEHLNIIKQYPSNSIFYSNATLLSERYNLNGLPRKGLDNNSLDTLIIEEEFKLIGLLV
jgi:tetratricopeptide (TPR) repeat protein